MKMELGRLYEQKNGRKAEGEDLRLIEKVAKQAGQDRYALNLAVLAVPNYLQVGKLMETFPLGRTAKSFWDDVKPNSVIFDEATSALDSITEEAITNTIREISTQQNQITVLIAHRLSTIMHANKIYVLEQGSIVETGSHESLLAEKGLYYAMWRQQIGERK